METNNIEEILKEEIETIRDSFYEEWNEYVGYHSADEWYLDPQ